MTTFLIGVLALALVVVGTAGIWSQLGPSDLGPVTFETLARRSSPNDALACPAGTCIARSDIESPVFAADVEELRLAMAQVIRSEPRVVQVAAEDAAGTERYVQRSLVFEFPDTIVVRYIALPGGRSTLALYSRSQVGYGDMGVNKARLQRWLGKLKAALPIAG